MFKEPNRPNTCLWNQGDDRDDRGGTTRPRNSEGHAHQGVDPSRHAWHANAID